MSILVVGSVALDSIKTPFGQVDKALGGAATYFSLSAHFFAPVNLVGVIGQDFPQNYIELLKQDNINIEGLTQEKGKSFYYKGEYNYDLNQRTTIDTQLNVFEHFSPQLPETYSKSRYVFLANIDPNLQLKVLQQVESPQLIACDTMNYWIENEFPALEELLKKVDILVINDFETRELAKEYNLIKAARKILNMGPDCLIVKRGEYGALMCSKEGFFWAPAFPLEDVQDPTGAGDSFAGGFMGYIAKCQDSDHVSLQRAVIFGSVLASYSVEDFSVNRLTEISQDDIIKRFHDFKKLTHFEEI
jgi:sugar/nucleoside kinase (ribokinase family)